jgi:glutamate synthase domain-containing protein 3
MGRLVETGLAEKDATVFQAKCRELLPDWDYSDLRQFCAELSRRADQSDEVKMAAITLLTHLYDRPIATGKKKRSSVLQMINETLTALFAGSPKINGNGNSMFRHVDWSNRDAIRAPEGDERVLVLNARAFPPEGEDCDAFLIRDAYGKGWKQFICYGYKGQRFTGCGLSADSDGVRIDVYDSSGDYLASGIDGLEIYVHGNAQDQLGQIIKRGKLVIYGDVGQTFMYGAKGGDVYVMGNAAGRPLINAVGRPRVVINGTCLDYLAESFMAGDPLNGGGFVVLNGMTFDQDGKAVALDNPYPGSNLFSLASGGAIYVRDPYGLVVEEQLNGGEFAELTPADWELIWPYLKENQNLFGIDIEADLLTVDGVPKPYNEVYRKVQPAGLAVLAKASTEVEEYGEDWQDS